jgi:hypothetical protein
MSLILDLIRERTFGSRGDLLKLEYPTLQLDHPTPVFLEHTNQHENVWPCFHCQRIALEMDIDNVNICTSPDIINPILTRKVDEAYGPVCGRDN